jgi:hypothetical protein
MVSAGHPPALPVARSSLIPIELTPCFSLLISHDADLDPDYEGHSFWDCETWMFPNLVAINPKQALALLEYRSARLLAARIRATTHGFRGAM